LSSEYFYALPSLFDGRYPGHWFNETMLKNCPCFGIRDGAGLASAAGVHVYSKAYQVAALGNIVTRPELRGRGFGQRVTVALCKLFLDHVTTIGLNVHIKNPAAIRLYKSLGFQGIASYCEYLLEEVEEQAT
jgi:predicted GNAT family acetyltransferase